MSMFLTFLKASFSFTLSSIFFQVITDDSKYTAMPLGFPKYELEEGEKKFVFRIPRFNQNVLVDPSVNVGKVKSAASWVQVNVVLVLVLQFAVPCAFHYY